MSITTVIFDTDGVLTNNEVTYAGGWPGSLRARTFYIPDGQGMKALMDAGLEVWMISGEEDNCIIDRAEKLDVKYNVGTRNKQKIYSILGLLPENCAYMGDDVNDLLAMKLARISACPADAHQEVIRFITLDDAATTYNRLGYLSTRCGGQGAARDFCDWLLSTGLCLVS